MTYKTILVHVDESRHAKDRIRAAIQLAKTYEALLIGAAVTGISRFAFQTNVTLPPDPRLTLHLGLLRQRANYALDQATQLVEQEGHLFWEKRITDDDAVGGVAELARYSDLAIVSQFDPEEPGLTVMPDFPEYMVLNSGRPTLILPHSGSFTTIGKRILIAWDGSRTATRAVADALPLLRQADLVQIAMFNQPEMPFTDPSGEAELARYLARQDVKIELLPSTPSSDVGNSLLSLASELGSDLIVMGGYGHSRFREILLGGVTRTILESMTVPVLMSH